MYKIPFNRPCLAGNELKYIQQAVESGKIAGDGLFTQKCSQLIEKKFNANKVLLTPSATHALEMASLLINIKPGDEIIAPSYTFVSTINAFVLRGAKPVFVDIRPDTLNIDENKIREKITSKTKAIFVVHYAGIACEMNKILNIAKENELLVIEDAAHGVNAKYYEKFLGTIGHFGVYSFHETKNYICGEGGALVINENSFIERAEIIREKGTNRSLFFRGQVDKYTWCDIGSSYLPSEIQSAFLYAQLEKLDEIQAKRNRIFDFYRQNLKELEDQTIVQLSKIPDYCQHNAHMFYLILNSEEERNKVINDLLKTGILAVFHYVPLHLSPMGKKFGYQPGDFPITERISSRLVRLPFYNDLSQEQLKLITNKLKEITIKKLVTKSSLNINDNLPQV